MLNKLYKSILAGIAIAIGAVIYLLCPNKIVGAFLFSVGILMVMEFKLLLYTGYVPTQRQTQSIKDYILNSCLVFIGNLIGGALTASLLSLTRQKDSLYTSTLALCEFKLEDSLLSIFILAIFCGIIIAGIVKATNLKHQMLYVGMMIATFILCGYEHVVANAYYFSASLKIFTLEGALFMLVCLLGNFAGGVICSFVKNPEKNSN